MQYERKEFRKSHVHVGSVLRSTLRMAAAGWIIDKMKLTEPVHRALAFGVAGAAVGGGEGLMKERKKRAAHLDGAEFTAINR